MLITNFSNIDEPNHTKAQNAGLIDASMLLLCKYSQINAHANGHKTNPIGQKKTQITIHIIHHRFHRLDHQNFLVHIIGKK